MNVLDLNIQCLSYLHFTTRGGVRLAVVQQKAPLIVYRAIKVHKAAGKHRGR